ncbi:MAG: protein-L-isoaspartate(D-aspartate) O-methyltransferase [Candidatus Thorarchaeota archaeon]|nr:protein-L-isoaspartate(D-aspartate) O-methyltransferase [Candidatus Thorarchaeota archaeon]
MNDHALDEEKERLIHHLKSMGYIRSSSVERAFRMVPREEFVRPDLRRSAYRDTPLPILNGQTISAPHMCAIMCEQLKLAEGHRILEVGAGSGYHAALCAEIIAPTGSQAPGHVYTLEIVESLVDFARSNLERAGYLDRVTLLHGDGGLGLPAESPFDRILVTAAAPKTPPPLIEQLTPGGIMLIPEGFPGFYQELMILEKDLDSNIHRHRWGGVAFVPLTGKFGDYL